MWIIPVRIGLSSQKQNLLRFLLCALLLPVFTSAQTDLNRIDSLSRESIAVRTIDQTDEDFSDLEPLVSSIGDSRVVVLGEAAHEDGATFSAKARMVRFLHQRMGFDVLAWEGGFMDSLAMNPLLRSPEIPFRQVRNGTWETSSYVRPVYEYARGSWKTSRPLEMTGFDRYRPLNGKRIFDQAMDQLFSKEPSLRPNDAERAFLSEVNKKVFSYIMPGMPALGDTEYQKWKSIILGIMLRLREKRQVLIRTFSSRALGVIDRSLQDVLSLGRSRYLISKYQSTKEIRYLGDENRMRDKDMAENLLWQLNSLYAGRKVIIWSATAHLIRNESSIKNRDGKNFYKNYEQMGNYIYRGIGKQLYTIAFTTYQGRSGTTYPPEYKTEDSINELTPAPDQSLEWYAHKIGNPYLFIPLRDVPRGHWLRQPLVSTCLGRLVNTADWSSVIDAFFFIDTMYPDRWLSKDQ